ncbi:hypothetical protein AS188_15705 (plasmid) [Kocuria flava]|uniref:Lsr2 family protein n=1 Tax=Kocuria flava TaxID=446860 RepID=A0A0U3GDZ7_9MICC|nr:Lsr2 family protein [Kocuria flava]ALU41339.1 hypothetical protein AS188_15705 [Kocuria flava]GEO93685.1 Lsr2 family protein [Kocuria flava]
MVQRVQVLLEDDLEGGPAEETVTFALDGRDYEIDLSAAHAERLREALRPFVAAARKATDQGRRSAGARSTRTSGGDAAKTAAIRAWARKHGHQVSTRGRIPATVREAYHAAAGGQP